MILSINSYDVTIVRCTTLRAGLDYGEEVHRSRISGEWSNMIGYDISSSHAEVYTTANTSLVENCKHG